MPLRGNLFIKPKQPPDRSPLKIVTKAPRKQPPTPPTSDFQRRKDELRSKVVARDPSLAEPPKHPIGPIERTPLKIKVEPKPATQSPPARTPLISIKPKPSISIKPKTPPPNISIKPKLEWYREQWAMLTRNCA